MGVYVMLGYEDANDVNYLKNDPLLQDVLEGELASKPTISSLENRLDKLSIFELCYAWVDRYVATLNPENSLKGCMLVGPSFAFPQTTW